MLEVKFLQPFVENYVFFPISNLQCGEVSKYEKLFLKAGTVF